MDKRSIKRPRTDTAPGADRKPTKPKKKSKSDKKKSKDPSSSSHASNSASGDSSALESTATAEGQMMAQVLSTFHPRELSRFESFRRSTFRGDAISNLVGRCLEVSEVRRYEQREGVRSCLGGAGYGVVVGNGRGGGGGGRGERMLWRCPHVTDSATSASVEANGEERQKQQLGRPPQRPLEDLVAPNSSQEITVVVSTLAKSYAQRLIASARRVAASEGYSDERPILPRHLREAHRHRVEAGVDPGFFVQPPARTRMVSGGLGMGVVAGDGTATRSAALGVTDRYRLRVDAALAAQEAYDAHVKEMEGVKKEEEQKSVGGANGG